VRAARVDRRAPWLRVVEGVVLFWCKCESNTSWWCILGSDGQATPSTVVEAKPVGSLWLRPVPARCFNRWAYPVGVLIEKPLPPNVLFFKSAKPRWLTALGSATQTHNAAELPPRLPSTRLFHTVLLLRSQQVSIYTPRRRFTVGPLFYASKAGAARLAGGAHVEGWLSHDVPVRPLVAFWGGTGGNRHVREVLVYAEVLPAVPSCEGGGTRLPVRRRRLRYQQRLYRWARQSRKPIAGSGEGGVLSREERDIPWSKSVIYRRRAGFRFVSNNRKRNLRLRFVQHRSIEWSIAVSPGCVGTAAVNFGGWCAMLFVGLKRWTKCDMNRVAATGS